MQKKRKVKKLKKIKLLSCFLLLILAFWGGISALKFHTTKPENRDISLGIYKGKDYNKLVEQINEDRTEKFVSQNNEIRKFPYPYNAMLALCSDIDNTTLEEFETYHQFLNTKDQTPYGQGLGLDVGDSMWVFDGRPVKKGQILKPEMTYYQGLDINKKNNADAITGFIRDGWIDTLHTFGDFSTANEKGSLFTRELGIEGWNTLKSIGFSPEVWINHGDRANVQNFGAAETSSFMSYQEGDNPKSIYYHTDLTMGNGIRFVWDSVGSTKFGENYPLFKISLRDGRKVWGFSRYTNNMVGNRIDWTWTPKNLYRQLTQSNLDSIVKNEQYSIVAQHFGKSTQDLFTEKNLKAFRLLKQYQDDKKILIAKTSRLLDYAEASKYVKYNKAIKNGITHINISGINDPVFGLLKPDLDHYRGLTFYTAAPEKTVIFLYGNQINKQEIQINPQDETGKESISIKWYAPDYTDYSAT